MRGAAYRIAAEHTSTGPSPPCALDPDLPAVLGHVVVRARLRTRLRAAWLNERWRSDGTAAGEAQTRLDVYLDGRDTAAAEADWLSAAPQVQELRHALGRVETALAADSESPLAQLQRTFALDTREMDLLQACIAAGLDPELGRAFALLQDHPGRCYPTEPLVARLYGHGPRRVLTPESPLRRWDLIQEEAVAPGEPAALWCDRLVRDFVLGSHRLDGGLVGVATLLPPLPPLPSWPVDALLGMIRRTLDSSDGVRPGGRIRVRLLGPSGSGRRSLAAALCARMQLSLLTIDGDRIDDADWPTVFLRAQRQAYLDRCALAWFGDGALRRRWPSCGAPFPIQFLIDEGSLPLEPLPEVTDHTVELPVPSAGERRAVWLMHVPAAATWQPQALDALASRHRVSLREIAELGARNVTTASEAAAVVRESSRHQLGELAIWMECPFVLDDLVAPEGLRRALDELIFEAENRAAFWEQPAARRLFPQGQGLFALFTGAPGTGKTMSAQIVAASLGLDLYRISLAAVVSKYVGETSRNLQRILSRAERMDVILLFDEADALFSKRTEVKDAHDRFANTDTDYLLQAIESYGGIALLTTNKKANIDAAFMRRLRHTLDFPRPDAGQRRRLWERLVAELAGIERAQALAPGLDALAAGIDATGAQIKYAILAALFAARREGQPLAMRHLIRGAERELLKEGRNLDEADRARLGRHAS